MFRCCRQLALLFPLPPMPSDVLLHCIVHPNLHLVKVLLSVGLSVDDWATRECLNLEKRLLVLLADGRRMRWFV